MGPRTADWPSGGQTGARGGSKLSARTADFWPISPVGARPARRPDLRQFLTSEVRCSAPGETPPETPGVPEVWEHQSSELRHSRDSSRRTPEVHDFRSSALALSRNFRSLRLTHVRKSRTPSLLNLPNSGTRRVPYFRTPGLPTSRPCDTSELPGFRTFTLPTLRTAEHPWFGCRTSVVSMSGSRELPDLATSVLAHFRIYQTSNVRHLRPYEPPNLRTTEPPRQGSSNR
jgi:hypothetical protein